MNVPGSLGATQLVGRYTHLAGFPREQHALMLLRKTASLVKPLMVNHSLRVLTLSEFFPTENPNLVGLNVNAGQQILLRLRPHNDPHSFMPEEEIIRTMLHELVHNTFGPHDEKFYGLLNSYTNEYERMRKEGWNGEGFYSPGHRLGSGRTIRDFVRGRRRAAAAEAAERRRRQVEKERVRRSGQTLGTSISAKGKGKATGKQLGAAPPGRGENIRLESLEEKRERLAKAAEKRNRDAVKCGVGRNMDKQVKQRMGKAVETKGEVEDERWLMDALEAIRIIEEEEEEEHRRGAESWNGIGQENGWMQQPSPMLGADQWACKMCTLLNPWNYLQCDVCGSDKPTLSATTSSSSGFYSPHMFVGR